MTASRFTPDPALPVSVDSAKFLIDQISNDIGYYRDILAFLGLLYGSKIAFGILKDCYVGIRTYILPRILKQPDFVQKYGKWAVVTGCTAGIGRGYANELAKRGMNLVLISRSKEKLEKVSKAIRDEYSVETIIIITDFAKDNDTIYDEIYNKIIASKIDLGILVNNVGIVDDYPRPMLESDSKTLANIINVNTKAATLLTNKLMPQMLENKRGAIINISSSCGSYTVSNMAVYGATKAYLDYFTKVVSLEHPHSTSGITMQAIAPGFIKSQMTGFLDSVEDKELAKMMIGERGSLGFPNADDFAASAIMTLGHSEIVTAGYWYHSLQFWMTSFFPQWVQTLLVCRVFGMIYEVNAKKK